MTTWSERTFSPGTLIKGTWRGSVYRIERLLGTGANGRVYLVRKGAKPYALKIGFDILDHQMEVNTLLSLSRSSASFRDYFIESDDMELDGERIPFSVIKYIDGITIRDFLKRRGADWLHLIGLNLLNRLQELHKQGWIFADMKLENILVHDYGHVELIDFGGLTAKGRSVKQFTELYDRGAWNAGDRIAEESYDLFAFAVLMLISADQTGKFGAFQRMLPLGRSIDMLLALVKSNPQTAPLYPWFEKALAGQLPSTEYAAAWWRRLTLENARKQRKDRAALPWLKVCFAASLTLCFATVCYFL